MGVLVGNAYDFPALLQQLHGELCQYTDLNQPEVWQVRIYEVVGERLESPHEFLDWAKQDHRWSFTLAEVMREVWSRPSELAARLLVAILLEMREEQQTAQSLSD